MRKLWKMNEMHPKLRFRVWAGVITLALLLAGSAFAVSLGAGQPSANADEIKQLIAQGVDPSDLSTATALAQQYNRPISEVLKKLGKDKDWKKVSAQLENDARMNDQRTNADKPENQAVQLAALADSDRDITAITDGQEKLQGSNALKHLHKKGTSYGELLVASFIARASGATIADILDDKGKGTTLADIATQEGVTIPDGLADSFTTAGLDDQTIEQYLDQGMSLDDIQFEASQALASGLPVKGTLDAKVKEQAQKPDAPPPPADPNQVLSVDNNLAQQYGVTTDDVKEMRKKGATYLEIQQAARKAKGQQKKLADDFNPHFKRNTGVDQQAPDRADKKDKKDQADNADQIAPTANADNTATQPASTPAPADGTTNTPVSDTPSDTSNPPVSDTPSTPANEPASDTPSTPPAASSGDAAQQ